MAKPDHSDQRHPQSAGGGRAFSSKRGKSIALWSAALVVLVVAVVLIVALGSRGSKEPVAARDDNSFLTEIYEVAANSREINISGVPISDEEYIAFGEDVCARGESGENWMGIYESAPEEELPRHESVTDSWSAEVLLRAAISAAPEFICPDQYDTAMEQITGLQPVTQN
jgi:hypothetical protein